MNEEKLKQINELMGNFVNSIAQRAETAKSVNDILNDDTEDNSKKPESKENTYSSEPSDDWEDTDTSDGWEDTETSDGWENTTSASSWEDTNNTQSNSSESYNNGSTKQYSGSNKSQFDEEEDDFSQKEVGVFNPEDWKKAWAESFQSTKAFFETERAKKQMEKERQSNKEPKQCNENVMFKKNTATFNGQPFEYKVLQKEVNWGTAFTKSFTMDSKITNLDKLNEKIIEDIKLTFGDLSRITEVAVISGMLIINGVQYYPLCRDKDFLDGLPFDCADYFKSGLLAEIFDFGYLHYMPYLTTIKIDSTDFAVRKFAYDIGMYGKFKIRTVFKLLKNLRYFELGDSTFSAPGRDINDEVEENIERHERAVNIYDNYILSNAYAFTGWNFNNLKTFACNRGDKGFLSYSGGVIARTGMLLGSGIGTLGLHAIGTVVKGGAKLLKKAFQEDI